MKREDAKEKRAAAASSGVVARRGRAEAAAKKRRRSQVERGLALKRADELLEKSGKAEDIRLRRGSLGTLRPEDVRRTITLKTPVVGEFEALVRDMPRFYRKRLMRRTFLGVALINCEDSPFKKWYIPARMAVKLDERNAVECNLSSSWSWSETIFLRHRIISSVSSHKK